METIILYNFQYWYTLEYIYLKKQYSQSIHLSIVWLIGSLNFVYIFI